MDLIDSLTDSVDITLARRKKSMEISKREKMLESYGSTLKEEKEEDGIQYTVFQMTRSLSCANRELTSVPRFIGEHYGDWLVRLDLSFNNILSINGITQCKTLEELILNCNDISDEGFCFSSQMPNLVNLVLNNNSLTDIGHFLKQCQNSLPNISILSLHGNPICQDSLLAKCADDEEDYERYRITVLHSLPTLTFLDSRCVSANEKEEAAKRGDFLTRVAKPKIVETSGEKQSKSKSAALDFKPLPETRTHQNMKAQKASAAREKYHYKGNHSEGNRFITDGQL